MVEVSHRIDWVKGTRWPAAAELHMVDKQGNSYDVTMEPILRFQVLGIGYNHPEWGHAMWKGELETGRDEWDLDALDPLAYEHLHVHQVVRARMGDREGIGTLENIVIGRHAPSGFKDFFDGAS
jgi:hypothetical protein